MVKIKEVEAAIDEIGEVSISNTEKLFAAEVLYNALSDEAKGKVSNVAALTAATDEYDSLLEAEYEGALSRMNVETDAIRNMSFYHPQNRPKYLNVRCNLLPYIATKGDTNRMLLRYNYAGDDWVFFESVIIAVDEARYTKTFKYSDITHGNGGGMVGELIDLEASDADIAMLRTIVNSDNTTVRFKGDDYMHDYTLTAADKAAIQDVLIVYDYMNR